jgi:hypothetical protein
VGLAHGDFIVCTQKEKPIRVNPVDVSPVDGPTSTHMHLNMHKWGFPSRNLMIKCHDKYKNQVVFPPNFVRNTHKYRDPVATVSLGAHVYRTSRRVQEHGYQMSGQGPHPVHLDEDLADSLYRSAKKTVTSPSNGLHIDYTYSISLGFNKEHYYLIMVVDGIDFIWVSVSQDHSTPKNMILEFLNMTGIKIGTIRLWNFASLFLFRIFVMNVVLSLSRWSNTHTFRMSKAKMIFVSPRNMYVGSNLPRTFWPYALRHFLRLGTYWPTDNGNRCVWELLDVSYPNNKLCHTLSKDLHVFGSYVTDHLSHTHPFVVDTTHDDNVVEGVWFGNDLCTPNFWMFTFKHKKVMKMSDPKHSDTILPFLQSTDVPHKIDLKVADIAKMHKDAGQDIDFEHTTSTIQTRSRAPALNADQIPSLSYPADSGDHSGNSGEIRGIIV